MAEPIEATNHRLFRLTTLSPRARSVISSNMYFIDTDKDEVDDDTVQQEAFLCLTEDMGEIGLYWAVDNKDVYANTYDLDLALDALYYLMPNTLYSKLRDNTPLVTTLRSLLQGDLSDGDLVLSYLDFIGGGDDHPPFDPEIKAAADYVRTIIRSTEIFADYLTSLLTKYDAERAVPVPHLSSPKEYHAVIAHMIQKMSDALHVCYKDKLITDQSLVVLERRLKLVQSYLGNATNIESFSFVLLTSPRRLSDTEKVLYKEKVHAFLVGCRLSFEYREARSLPISQVDLCGIISFLYSRASTDTLFDKKIENLKKQLETQSSVITNIAQSVKKLYEQEEG